MNGTMWLTRILFPLPLYCAEHFQLCTPSLTALFFVAYHSSGSAPGLQPTLLRSVVVVVVVAAAVVLRTGHEGPEVLEVYLYSFFNLGARGGWVVNATHRPLCLQEGDSLPIV